MNERQPGSRFRIGHVTAPSSPADRARAVLEDGEQLWDLVSPVLEQLISAERFDELLDLLAVVREAPDTQRSYLIHKAAATILTAQPDRGNVPKGDFSWARWFDLVPAVLVPALDSSPAEPELLNLLGIAYYELGETAVARRLFEAIKEIEPDHFQARLNLKACKERQGRTTGGVGSGQIPTEYTRRSKELHTAAKRIAERAVRLPERTISLCMIVKNEEEMLPGCLAAVAEHVDQVIVCDTGSTDRTKEIAEEYGAQVVEFPWNGSFSDARNASIAPATGDWILYLDADEHLVDDDGAMFRQLARKSSIEGFYLVENNYTGELEFGNQTSHMALRMYRNRPQYQFEGIIHEQKMRHMPNYLPERFQNSAVRINHYGYLKNVVEDRSKRERNLELLMQQAEEGEDSFTEFNIGSEYGAMHDWDQARGHFERALMLARDEDPDTWQFSQFAPMMVSRASTCRRATGDHEGALELTAEGLSYWPDFTDLVYERALTMHEMGNDADAITEAEKCVQMGDAPARYVAVQGKGSHQARVLLAGMLRRQGDPEGARDHLITAVTEAPQYLPTILELADTLLMLEDADQVATTLEELLGDRAQGANASLLLATAFYEAGQLAHARTYYERVLAGNAEHPAALIGLAELQLAEHEFTEALDTVRNVDPLDRFASRAARTEFLAAVACGNTDALARPLGIITAAEHLSVGERAFYAAWNARLTGGAAVLPADANAAAQLLLNLEALAKLECTDEFAALVPLLEQAVPDPRERHLLLGGLYLRRQFIDMAGDEYLEAAQRFGPDPELLTGLGKVATAKELWEDAQVFLTESLRLDPAQSDAQRLLELVEERVPPAAAHPAR